VLWRNLLLIKTVETPKAQASLISHSNAKPYLSKLMLIACKAASNSNLGLGFSITCRKTTFVYTFCISLRKDQSFSFSEVDPLKKVSSFDSHMLRQEG